MSGWVKIPRDLLDSDISSRLDLLGLYVYLNCKVNFEHNEFYMKGWNQKISLEAGQGVFSLLGLAKQFDVSEAKMRKMIEILEREQKVRTERTSKFTIITVIGRGDGFEEKEQKKNKKRTEKEQKKTIKEYKEIKECIENNNMRKNSIDENNLSLKNHGKSNTPPPTPSPLMTREDFEQFWKIRPRRLNKAKAEKIFLELPRELLEKILHAVAQQWEHVWQGKEEKRIPHPTTWLNGRRWEDEIYPASKNEQTASEAGTKNYRSKKQVTNQLINSGNIDYSAGLSALQNT